jgi:hypothetical protein
VDATARRARAVRDMKRMETSIDVRKAFRLSGIKVGSCV